MPGVEKQSGFKRHGTWKLTMSFPRPSCSCPKGFRRPPRPRAEHVWPWQPKREPDQHGPKCPQLSPSGRPLPCCGFGAWNLLGPNPNPNPKPKPASIPNPAIDCLLAWALTSALERDHETAVSSAMPVSLEKTLTLANAQSPWGPNCNV